MTTQSLRRTSAFGLFITPLIGLVLLGLLFAGIPTLTGWGFFVTPAFVFGLGPLLVGYLLVFVTPLRFTPVSMQVIELLVVVLTGFFVVFLLVPILDSSAPALAARQAVVASLVVVVEHAAIFGCLRGAAPRRTG